MHPVHLIGAAEFTMIELWRACQDGALPCAGGALDQPPLAIAALRVIDDALAVLRGGDKDG